MCQRVVLKNVAAVFEVQAAARRSNTTRRLLDGRAWQGPHEVHTLAAAVLETQTGILHISAINLDCHLVALCLWTLRNTQSNA